MNTAFPAYPELIFLVTRQKPPIVTVFSEIPEDQFRVFSMSSPAKDLFDYFPLPYCEHVQWNTDSYSKDKNVYSVCEFSYGDSLKIQYFAQPDPYCGMLKLLVPKTEIQDDACRNRHTIAQAITEIVNIEFSFEDEMRSPSPATIQIYKSVPKLRDSFSLLHNYLTGNFNRTKKAGYTYLISDQNGHYKIGRSTQLTNRLTQLATQPPFELQLLAAGRYIDCHSTEAWLHERYKAKRLRGEWFSLTREEAGDVSCTLRCADEIYHAISRSYQEFEYEEFLKYEEMVNRLVENEWIAGLKWYEFHEREKRLAGAEADDVQRRVNAFNDQCATDCTQSLRRLEEKHGLESSTPF